MGKNLKNIQNIVEGYSPWEQKMKQSKALSKKWEKTGLLEGLDGYDRNNMAILLENQARELIKESTTTGNTAGSEEWSGVALPLVRRVFGELASKEFVSIQPMNLPAGLVFYVQFKYGTAKKPQSSGGSIFGTTSGSSAPTAGLYGAGQFSYSINNFTASSIQVTTGSVSASWEDVDFNNDLSASAAASQLWKLTVLTSSLSSKIDTLGVRAFAISGAAADSAFEEYYPAYTRYSSSNESLTFIVSGANDANSGSNLKVWYHKQPVSYDRGDFEENTTNTPISVPQIDLSFESKPIVAKTRKLKAVWTPEIAQDLNAFHAVDAEAELTQMLSEYITMEIDLEILDMLLIKADTTAYWSANPGVEWNGTSFATNSQYYISDKSVWYQTLGIKIAWVSNQIHAKTMRGGANFLVCSPDLATIVESMQGWNAEGIDPAGSTFAMGVQKIGILKNKWTVYKNPYMTENVILIGYRGSTFLETGAVFAPYIPLIMSPLIYDPDTFVPRKGVMTRYAKEIVREEFYGKIIVHGLNTL